MVLRLYYLCSLASLLAVAGAYAELGFLPAIGIFVLLLSLSYSGMKLRRFWSTHLTFGMVIGACAIGVLLQLDLYLLSIAIASGLAAWDLARFHQRLHRSDPRLTSPSLENRHVKILSGTLVAGLAFALLSLSIRVQLSLGIVILLGAILVLGLSWAIRTLSSGREI